jgi:hypothetical protein
VTTDTKTPVALVSNDTIYWLGDGVKSVASNGGPVTQVVRGTTGWPSPAALVASGTGVYWIDATGVVYVAPLPW